MGWVVEEVVPITCLLSNLWELLLCLLIMPCYASRLGLGECIHDICEFVKLMVCLRWQLKQDFATVKFALDPD